MHFSVDLKSNPNHRRSKYPENISQAGVIALLLPIAIPFNSIWAAESQPVDASAPVLHPPSQRVVHPPFPLPILPFSPILPSHSLYPPFSSQVPRPTLRGTRLSLFHPFSPYPPSHLFPPFFPFAHHSPSFPYIPIFFIPSHPFNTMHMFLLFLTHFNDIKGRRDKYWQTPVDEMVTNSERVN